MLFDFVVLNIAMVQAIIIQVNITLEEVKVKEEMQNYAGEKSILAVFEEILLKSSCEHSKLLKDKTKVTEGGEKTLQ